MMPAWQDAEEKAQDGEYGPEVDIKVPTTFQGWMALIGKTLAPGGYQLMILHETVQPHANFVIIIRLVILCVLSYTLKLLSFEHIELPAELLDYLLRSIMK